MHEADGISNMYTPVFRDAVPSGDYRDWWRLIRRLAGELYEVELPEIGRTPARARTLQAQLGVKRLPPSLVEWIAFVGDLKRRSDWATEDLDTFRAGSFPRTRPSPCTPGACTTAGHNGASGSPTTRHDDPPVSVYGYVSTRNVHVRRKSYPRLPLSQFALHNLLNCGYSNYGFMGSELEDPEAFLRSLPAGVPVSAPFGSLRFIEGTGWLAYVRNGPTTCGREKRLTLRFTEGVRFRDIPKPIRDLVQMKPSFLRVTSRREHRK